MTKRLLNFAAIVGHITNNGVKHILSYDSENNITLEKMKSAYAIFSYPHPALSEGEGSKSFSFGKEFRMRIAFGAKQVLGYVIWRARLNFYLLFLCLLQFHFCEAGNPKIIYVNDRKTPCAGTYECLQIKEKAKNNWEITADTIAGFNYEEGYTYKILVTVTEPKNTYAGILRDKYSLVKIVSKTKTNYNPAEKLENKTWCLRELKGEREGMSAKDTVVYIRLNVKSGKINGRGICNNFTGNFKAEGHVISFGGIASTKMYCEGVAFEKTFIDFLGAVKSYILEDSQLTFLCGDKREMIFSGE